MNYASILKSGSLIKAGSNIDGIEYASDTTLTADLNIQAFETNTKKSTFTYTQIEKAINFVTTQVAEPFSTSSTYAVDDFVTHDGFLYQCITAVTTAGAWDATKWQIQKIFDNNGYVIIKGGEAPQA